METQTNLSVAKEILNQLGGNRFIAMTGAKYICGDEKSLRFQFMRNSGKYKGLVIALNSMDTYDLKFWKQKKVRNLPLICSPIIYTEINGIYGDMLQEVFTSKTGLNTHL
ncbi:hypothetical protein LCGC14_2687100 [marine sediment metagenome]|uniref:Uncharacterized protein n=1 Tax=marine sediment metagenome TaxID=412755 RepID=A0A0F9BUD5_9ZZZZ